MNNYYFIRVNFFKGTFYGHKYKVRLVFEQIERNLIWCNEDVFPEFLRTVLTEIALSVPNSRTVYTAEFAGTDTDIKYQVSDILSVEFIPVAHVEGSPYFPTVPLAYTGSLNGFRILDGDR